MSDCTRLGEMLTADVETLKGRSDTDLARHIAGCPGCTAAAARILAATGALAEALDSAPAPDPALLLQRATEPRRTGLRELMQARPRWALPAVGAATAAAALYLVFAVPGPALVGEPWAPPPAAAPPLVDAPGPDIVVFPTTDPHITIIWLVKGEPE